MELMAPHVVRPYKCPAAGDVVDVSVDIEPIDELAGGLGGLYCRVFLQFTVVPFVLELSVGFGHLVRRVLNHHSPSLLCGLILTILLVTISRSSHSAVLSSGLRLSWGHLELW